MSNDLFALLNLGAGSLSTYRSVLSVASHNIQNADTPGYSRQIAQVEAVNPAAYVGVGYIGRGARLTGVTQARDRFIEIQMPQATANRARSTATHDSLMTVRALDPTETSSVGNAVAEFYASLRNMAQNPGDAVLRRNVVETARALTITLNPTAVAIESARSGLDRKIEYVLSNANVLGEKVAGLNSRIAAARGNNGSDPNDLLDARQAAADELAEMIGGVSFVDGNGSLNVMLPGGTAFVAGTTSLKLTAVADLANRGHVGFYVSAQDGSSFAAYAKDGIGGTVGGLVDARDGAMKKASDTMDLIASELAANMNAIHQTGFALDGTTGRDFFSVGALEGAAATLAVHEDILDSPANIAASASAATVPGDATRLLEMVETELAPLSTGVDPIATLSRMTSDFGSATQLAGAVADQDATLHDHLLEARESVSGVSIDEEIINLTKAQRAFEATMKVIQTADQLLETLMKIR
jgi:flagellar hook-associated protein 1